MSKPIIKIHNTETDEIVEREMTDSEYQQHLKDVATFEAEQAERQAKAEAKATAEAKLAKLGLTTDDLRALGL